MNKYLVYVLYDSIYNSVFEGQILVPLLKRLNCRDVHKIYLISFERGVRNQEDIERLNTLHKNLSFVVLKRSRFIHPFFLLFQIRALRKILDLFPSYNLFARGPMAGYIAQHAVEPAKCSCLTIQARGLLTEEYRFVHKPQNWLQKAFHNWRAQQYEKIENFAYGTNKSSLNYKIEVVSEALIDYLIKNFESDRSKCFLAQYDVPEKVQPAQCLQWRSEIRNKLGISFDACVYCFVGALKKWQSFNLVVDYFIKEYQRDNTRVLLVLTQDAEFAKQYLKSRLPRSSYRIIHVAHHLMMHYLSAGDVGIAMRDKSIVSWVARPVKAMEYEVVGLKIVHNNTVDWLIKRFDINPDFH